MSEGLAASGAEVDDLSASALLTLARSRKAAEDQAAADLLEIAARWADLHPPESIHLAAAFTSPGSEHEEPIAGDGCPLVAEFCIAELGAVLGISTTAAKKLIGHALELRHRLPRLWDRVHSGSVPAWRARSVAETTIHTTPALTVEAAAWVDVQVAAVTGRVGTAQMERLVAEAIKRFELADPDPAEDPEDGYLSVDPRHATVHDQDVHFAGTMRIEAEVDIADALDLDHAIAHDADVQKALGSTESLDVRRAKALGNLARTQTALDLLGPRSGTDGRTDPTSLPAAREVVLHAHLDASVGDGVAFGPTGRLDNGQRLVLLDHIRDWCTDARAKVTIKPVIDLNQSLSTPAYEVPDRIREHVILRDRTCVFPWCSRSARRCDVDHVTAFDHDTEVEGRAQPGPTRTDNLAALCRSHHRLKTHTAWRYRVVGPGAYEWTSPQDTRSDATPSAPRLWTIHASDHDPAPHPARHHEGGAAGLSELRKRARCGRSGGGGVCSLRRANLCAWTLPFRRRRTSIAPLRKLSWSGWMPWPTGWWLNTRLLARMATRSTVRP